MQESIKFDLTAKTAILRKPESNEIYYTYNFPHKIMVLGMLGAIIGLNGYNYYALKKNLGQDIEEMPEFYTKLQNLKIAIIPKIQEHNFPRKIQTFNNSVGYASKEEGNNLVVKEQWLENPCWQIYILEDETSEYKKIKDYLLHRKCEYIPYIGKNDHFADIKNVEMVQVEKVQSSKKIDSIFKENIIEGEIEDFEEIFAFSYEGKEKYSYKEVLPTKLSAQIGYQEFEPFLFTNKEVKIKEIKELYKVKNFIIYYF